MIICPNCHSGKIKRNGRTHYGKQNHKCKACGRQFVLNNQHTIPEDYREIVRRALLERISLRGICRLLGVSLTWVLQFATQTWAETPDQLGVSPDLLKITAPKKLQVTGLQMDEMWSFVGNKRAKAWIWVVYEPEYKQVITYHIGDRSAKSLRQLWNKIPYRFRQHCFIETDHWEAYRQIVPEKAHVVGKAYTFYIESFFSCVRSRVSRLVRRSKSFSKKWENHEAAIKYFFWQYNLSRQPYI